MTHRATRSDDPLAPWLESLKPSTGVFCRAAVRAPWGFRIDARDDATFHVLTRGDAYLEVDGVPGVLRLSEGDLVLLAGGAAHQLRDAPSSAVRPLAEAVSGGTAQGKEFSFGGDGERSVMVCGGCHLGASEARRSLLPPIVRHACEPALVRLVEREAASLAAGGEAVLIQVLALLVTQALRAHLTEQDATRRNIMLSGPISRALSHIHGHLDRDIRIEDLCAVAKLSRTTLTDRFQEILGMPPVRYLRSVRMSRALDLLKNGSRSLQGVARSVGYSSASTFSRAFRREFGVSPGHVRTE